MYAAAVLLCVLLPVFQENQQSDEIRSTHDLSKVQVDSVQLPGPSLYGDMPTTNDVELTEYVGQVNVGLPGLKGTWQLSWNDDLNDGEFQKSCVVEFQDKDDVLNGKFIGPVAGRERDAILSGRLEGGGATRILTFQQREDGYICSYQGTISNDGITGVWHDTQNRSGKFQMLKYQ